MTYLNLPVDIRTGTDDRDTVSVLGVMAPWWVPGAEQSGAMVIFHDAALHTSLEGSRTRFLSVVSHELGSPVTSISAAADRLAKRLDTADLEQWRLLEIIRSEAARVRRLLGQFLSTSPARAEIPQPARSVVTLPLLIRRAAHMLRIRDTRHQIVVHLPNDLPFVWGDADSVQQVLSNLADNAIKYSAPGTLITLSATARKDDVLASVTDQGQGVAPGNEERIFEPAYRFCQDGQEIEGQGLGLAMARALIEAQGGELWYRRHPPGGACFCFTLPRVEDLPDEEGDADHGNHNPDR
jgi:two-component system sensor histidine kinase KdpD